MRLMLIAAALAVALAGCATTPENDATQSADTQSTSGQTGASRDSTSAGGSSRVVEQSPVESGVKPGSRDDFEINVGDRVFFAFDRFDLSDEARRTIERQVAWLRRYPTVSVIVEGHTDERGTREYNLALGERRATAVRDYMIALGIDPRRVSTVSYGKERPVDTRANEEAWAKNRRGVTTIESSSVSLVR